MNSMVTHIEPRRSVTTDMANRFGMEPAAFEQTLRATVFPGTGTKEQFAAFLLVAKQYDLNPITKELYAFPAKGGGIVPIVSIDGWLKLLNSHPQFDGMEFDDIHDEKGELIATKCTLWRKDRSKPVIVTEYLSECVRPTEPWKMKHRMLRHKALIQTARYAFGFAGIYDPDEGERIVEAQTHRDADPRPAPSPAPAQARPAPRLPPAPPPPPKATTPPPPPAPAQSPGAFDFDAFRADLQKAATGDEANAIFDRWIAPREKHMSADEMDEANSILREVAAPFWTSEE